MKMVLCASCAKAMNGKDGSNSVKDKCQACKKIKWCAAWQVKV